MSKPEVKALSAEQIQQMLDVSPFNLFLGLTVVSADPVTQEVTMRSAMRPEFERRPGSKQWHGGVIASVIDTVGDFAVGMMVGRGLPTVNFRVDYLRPAVGPPRGGGGGGGGGGPRRPPPPPGGGGGERRGGGGGGPPGGRRG
ncbi:PaaI family thioesterase, partial [Rhodopseudomonas sp. BAL398]|uniref:PaaI family thioesterase n=1 Tax=Rhodopseudomonas sp. BAL398 TaxID=3034676 RepID=UPI0023E170C3